MKFQKGILSDDTAKKGPEAIGSAKVQKGRPGDAAAPAHAAVPKTAAPPVTSSRPGVLQDDRLFETREEFEGSSRNYLKLFAIVVGLVAIAGAAIFYFTLPGSGDQVRGPEGAEDAVRENFLSKQKRTATDVVFFQCDGYYWARVGVETRKDIPNPLFKVGTYAARASKSGDSWEITAAPITSPEQDVPCK